MPATMNRRASVHTSNEDGVSIQGPINLPESVWKPEAKKVAYRRRASVASISHAEVTAVIKRRTSASDVGSNADQEPHLIRRPTTNGCSGRSKSIPDSFVPARLPKLPSSPPPPGLRTTNKMPSSPPSPGLRTTNKMPSSPPSPGLRTNKCELRAPSPKTTVSKTPRRSPSGTQSRSPSGAGSNSTTPSAENGNGHCDDNNAGGSTGWVTKTPSEKRMSRLQVPVLARKDLSPGAFKKERLPSLSVPALKPSLRHLIIPDPNEFTEVGKVDAESLGPGEDLSKLAVEENGFTTLKFDSLKKTLSQPCLLLSKIGSSKAQLTGLERTLANLKEELNSEQFRQSYQKMIERPRSARSERILARFPDYVKQQNEEIFAQRQLYKTRCEIRETLQQSHTTMEISSSLLLKHFKDVPNKDLSSYIACFFDIYDVNKNGMLETFEVQKALQDLGKPCSIEDVKEFFANAGAPGHSIDRTCFENMVRTMQGWEALPATPSKAWARPQAVPKLPAAKTTREPTAVAI